MCLAYKGNRQLVVVYTEETSNRKRVYVERYGNASGSRNGNRSSGEASEMYKVKQEEYIENRASNSRSFVLSGVHMGMFVVARRKEKVGRSETGEVVMVGEGEGPEVLRKETNEESL